MGDVVIPKCDLGALSVCDCSEAEPCSNDTECMNRMMYEECHPDVCKCTCCSSLAIIL